MDFLICSFHRSGSKTKCDVEFNHSTAISRYLAVRVGSSVLTPLAFWLSCQMRNTAGSYIFLDISYIHFNIITDIHKSRTAIRQVERQLGTRKTEGRFSRMEYTGFNAGASCQYTCKCKFLF